MIASKVVISQETRRRLDNPALSAENEYKLRQELVKDYIRKSECNEATKQELIAAAGFDPNATSKGYAHGAAFIKSMIKNGIISHAPAACFRKV